MEVLIGFGDLDINGYFDRLYVYKDYQGAYVATRILNEIEKYAQEIEIKVITTHSSITAKPFFEKQGYKVVKEQVVERKGQILKNFIMEIFIKIK